MSSCTHYRCKPGIVLECDKGHDIRSLVGGPHLGWMARMPCVKSGLSKDVVPCEDFDDSDQEERDTELIRFSDKVLAGICPTHGTPLDQSTRRWFCPVEACEVVALSCGSHEVGHDEG